jgi:hypothetical protein
MRAVLTFVVTLVVTVLVVGLVISALGFGVGQYELIVILLAAVAIAYWAAASRRTRPT